MKKISYTQQELKNHKKAYISIALLFGGGILIVFESMWTFTIGWFSICLSWFLIAATAYSHGWELKRISEHEVRDYDRSEVERISMDDD